MKQVVKGFFGIGIMVLCMASSVVAGPEIKIGDDAWMQIAFLGQAHYSFVDGAEDKDDFYLRRGRIILSGQMMDGVKFFMETDNDNAGKQGTSGVNTDIQDAFLDLRVMDTEKASLWVQGGLILLPFSLENKSSAASLLGLDYNAEAVKFVNSFVWRDMGVEAHGHIAKRVSYHVGVFDGYDKYATSAIEKNTDAPLRYTGHVAVNVLGAVEQGQWFCSQNRLGDKGQYLVVGGGLDVQDEATSTIVDTTADPLAVSVEEDSEAWVVDFQSSFDVGDDMALLVNGAYYDWENAAFKGNTAFVESGVLVKKAMVTLKYSQTDPDDSATADTEDYTAGVHYFLKGKDARIGVEHRWGDSADWTLAGIQFLL
jgi:hypothetical protein